MIATPPGNQCSDNRSAPIILQQSIKGDEALFSLLVPDYLIYFKDHFPSYPILPGVVQIKWATDLAAQMPLPDLFQENFSAITKLKFMRMIFPGNRLNLQLTVSSVNKTLNFRFFNDKGDYSSGQMNFS